MGWAVNHIKKLQTGETIQFKPRGNSMKGKIDSGNLVTVGPIIDQKLKKGDIVLCKVKGREYLHLVKAIREKQYQIGNNRGHINGWISAEAVFGICVKIEK